MSDCLFCQIINQQVPSTKVYEDENVYAFLDIDPQAPQHIVIVPKEHFKNLSEVDDNNPVLANLLTAAKKIAQEKNLNPEGYRVVINTGEKGGQTVDHLHLHLLGGRDMKWPPG